MELQSGNLQEMRPVKGKKRIQNVYLFIATHLEETKTLMQKSLLKRLQKFHYPYHRYPFTTKHLIVHFHPFAAVGAIFNNGCISSDNGII